MTLYGYCIRRAGEPPPPAGVWGVEGAEIRLLEEGPLGVWMSQGEPGPATEERLRAHDRVVRCALRSATPLPLRYGTGRFRDEDEARAALRSGESDFLERLERVADRVEMGVRIGWTPPPLQPAPETGPAGAGRAYLEARRRQLRMDAEARAAAAAVVERVEDCLAELGLPAVRSVLPETGTAGILAHLVHRSQIKRYHQQVEQARRALPEHPLIVTGPWAPYSFV